jgi:hypothetical protein
MRSRLVCPTTGRVCGKLDEDGQLPLWIQPRSGRVWRGDLLLRPDRSGAVRIDPLLLARSLQAGLLVRRDRAQAQARVTLALRVEEPTTTRDVELELELHPILEQLASRLRHNAGGPASWAAVHDETAVGPHPIALVSTWGGPRPWAGRRVDDQGRFLEGLVLPPDARLGELELLGTIDLRPTVLGRRCARCALGDLSWPDVQFRCQRVRMDSVVTVYEARTGRRLASRRFAGSEPGPCGDNVSHLEVRGGTSSEIEPWLLRTFVRPPP